MTTLSATGVIGQSAALKQILDLAQRVAPTNAHVLISGETGTGKEIIAKTIHLLSPRKDHPFVAVNCSAIPDNLLESELFGHSKGAFTGAFDKKLGLFEEAEGGVLFLDEIGDMTPELQAKLLRVIQEHKIKRVGENQYRPIDVRIIAATHRDLKSEIISGQFREDLYYRLCVIPIHIPPLRERPEDIVPLAQHFFERFRLLNHSSVKGFSAMALERLVALPWYGNVRELENIIERAIILTQSDYIDIIDLPDVEQKRASMSTDEDLLRQISRGDYLPSLSELNQWYVKLVLKSVGGIKEKASHILKIDRKTLYRRCLALERDENDHARDHSSVSQFIQETFHSSDDKITKSEIH